MPNFRQLLPNVNLWVSILAIIFVLLGVVSLYQTQSTSSLQAQSSFPNQYVQPDSFNAPVHIQIQRIGLNIDVIPGVYNTQKIEWDQNETKALFAVGSKSQLIYGHNTNNVFGKINKVGLNDILQVKYSSGDQDYFYYYKKAVVKPNDTSVLKESDPDTVILMTCTGMFNQYRQLVYFTKLSQYESPNWI